MSKTKQHKNQRNGMNTHRWRGPRGLRARALERDGHACTYGLPGCTGTATTVHIDPNLNGDHRRATLDDCRSACHRCHGRIDGHRSRGGTARPAARRDPAEVAEIPPLGLRSREW